MRSKYATTPARATPAGRIRGQARHPGPHMIMTTGRYVCTYSVATATATGGSPRTRRWPASRWPCHEDEKLKLIESARILDAPPPVRPPGRKVPACVRNVCRLAGQQLHVQVCCGRHVQLALWYNLPRGALARRRRSRQKNSPQAIALYNPAVLHLRIPAGLIQTLLVEPAAGAVIRPVNADCFELPDEYRRVTTDREHVHSQVPAPHSMEQSGYKRSSHGRCRLESSRCVGVCVGSARVVLLAGFFYFSDAV